VRHAVDLQAAGLAANSVLLIAEALGINLGRSVRLVDSSILLALVSVPVWWWWLSGMRGG